MRRVSHLHPPKPIVIAIAAATGNIGRVLWPALAEAGKPVRLLVRNPLPAAEGDPGVETAVVDLDRPDTLVKALSGADRLFLLSPGPDTPAQDAAAIRAAHDAGVRHVVLLSSLGVELGGVGGGRPHAPGEQLLRDSGLDWTILRPNEFMTNTLWWVDEIAARGTVSVPSADGRVGYVDPADIAAVAAAALTVPGHEGAIHRLTGPKALTTAEAAAALSDVLERPVEHVNVTEEQYREGAAGAGTPAPMVDMLSEYYAAVREGRMAVLTDDIEQILGRPPRDYSTWARAAVPHAAA